MLEAGDVALFRHTGGELSRYAHDLLKHRPEFDTLEPPDGATSAAGNLWPPRWTICSSSFDRPNALSTGGGTRPEFETLEPPDGATSARDNLWAPPGTTCSSSDWPTGSGLSRGGSRPRVWPWFVLVTSRHRLYASAFNVEAEWMGNHALHVPHLFGAVYDDDGGDGRDGRDGREEEKSGTVKNCLMVRRWQSMNGLRLVVSGLAVALGHHLILQVARRGRFMALLVLRTGDTLVDPCCGSGTIVFEAQRRGIHSVGLDIQQGILLHASENLQHVGVQHSVGWGPSSTINGPHNSRKAQWESATDQTANCEGNKGGKSGERNSAPTTKAFCAEQVPASLASSFCRDSPRTMRDNSLPQDRERQVVMPGNAGIMRNGAATAPAEQSRLDLDYVIAAESTAVPPYASLDSCEFAMTAERVLSQRNGEEVLSQRNVEEGLSKRNEEAVLSQRNEEAVLSPNDGEEENMPSVSPARHETPCTREFEEPPLSRVRQTSDCQPLMNSSLRINCWEDPSPGRPSPQGINLSTEGSQLRTPVVAQNGRSECVAFLEQDEICEQRSLLDEHALPALLPHTRSSQHDHRLISLSVGKAQTSEEGGQAHTHGGRNAGRTDSVPPRAGNNEGTGGEPSGLESNPSISTPSCFLPHWSLPEHLRRRAGHSSVNVSLGIADARVVRFEPTECVVSNLPFGRFLKMESADVAAILRNLQRQAKRFVFFGGAPLRPLLEDAGYITLHEVSVCPRGKRYMALAITGNFKGKRRGLCSSEAQHLQRLLREDAGYRMSLCSRTSLFAHKVSDTWLFCNLAVSQSGLRLWDQILARICSQE
ncbi:hypothetical protein CBR_g21113 [Chara braunii]|uniref:Uncharacterized protein n=1 Tax=Chara braunii TaxID=69332 RepID=A0A388L0N7_CHABU|nr:hypothetical protein CBR_g21113 [Chara braunii]|eukprot:GBG75869.1 hypothetical protein CBR_g21113 [Chara braunii]